VNIIGPCDHVGQRDHAPDPEHAAEDAERRDRHMKIRRRPADRESLATA